MFFFLGVVAGYQSNRPSTWSKEGCLIERPTDAYGRINFVNQFMASKPAKVLLSDFT